MRNHKLKKGVSTKAERIFAEALKTLHIKFEAKVKIAGKEVDFVIGNYAIDIDGHKQDGVRNEVIASAGYIPIHYSNIEVHDKNLLNRLKYYDRLSKRS